MILRLAVALLVAAGGALAVDCTAGCPLDASGAGAGVCARSGVTFANECLAVCSGSAVAHAGPCGAPSAGAASAVAAAAESGGGADTAGLGWAGGRWSGAAAAQGAPAARLAGHPIGQFLAEAPSTGPQQTAAAGERLTVAGAGVGAGAGDAAARMVATAADIGRFADEGYVLAGAARLDTFAPSKQQGPGQSARRPSDRMTIYSIRILPAEGLVYVSSSALVSSSRRLDAGPPRQFVPSRAATKAFTASADGSQQQQPQQLQQQQQQQQQQDAGSGGSADSISPAAAAAAAAAVASATTGGRSGGIAPRQSIDDDWQRVASFIPKLPLSAIGMTELIDNAGWHYSCTGAIFAPYAFVTAAHCVFNREQGTALVSGTFVPYSYCTDPNCNFMQLQRPYGKADVFSYELQAGWRTSATLAKAWSSDVAVVTLRTDVGSRTGMLGFGYDILGYTGDLDVAGYPSETVLFGQFYRLRGTCSVKDVNGRDNKLQLLMNPKPKAGCTTACAISEKGQSGQPAWSTDGTGGYIIRGVLSHGPDPGTCGGFDTYTQLDQLQFNMLSKYLNWQPS